MSVYLQGDLRDRLHAAKNSLLKNQVVQRIWDKDHTVWSAEPTEITNRLGWLQSPEVMFGSIPEIEALVAEVKAAGFTHALLLGMGGSSLAPEVFHFTFGAREGFLELAVLDSTDSGAVLNLARKVEPEKTLFIVSTKSGGTVETLSFLKYFYNHAVDVLGRDKGGVHFAAITDPASSLEKMAGELNFRKIFLNDPDIGGRYSVLSYFGLAPAGLLGMDLRCLLERAKTMAEACRNPVPEDNPGAVLGAVIGELALAGRDKLTLLASPQLRHFGAWVEQLVAESTGKEGKGILPVDLEEPGPPEVYGDDRLFVYSKLAGDTSCDGHVAALKAAGHPVVELILNDLYDLGGEFFRWQFATAVACHILGVNPFDQPNVESAKMVARKMVSTYTEKGELPQPQATLTTDNLKIYTDVEVDTLQGALEVFFASALADGGPSAARSYVAIQAYLQPTTATEKALRALATKIRDKFKLATTIGFGPRFLHSTGQLHKGDAGNGLFIQITADTLEDTPIPNAPGNTESCMSFGVLKTAQALGDHQALKEAGRKVIRLHLEGEVREGLQTIIDRTCTT